MLPAWLALHGHGPALQAVLIILGTFVLEDAATVLAAMDVQVGHVSLMVGLAALYVGIVLGDIGLYGLGVLAARVPWARRWAPPERLRTSRDWLQANLVRTVVHQPLPPRRAAADLYRLRLPGCRSRPLHPDRRGGGR